MKYFVTEEQYYDDRCRYTWEVEDKDSDIFLSLQKANEFGSLEDVLSKKPKDDYSVCSFDEYLRDQTSDIQDYLHKRSNYKSWKKIIETRGRFDGASMAVHMDGTSAMSEDERERFEATHGVRFIEETQRVIDKLDKLGVLGRILNRWTH